MLFQKVSDDEIISAGMTHRGPELHLFRHAPVHDFRFLYPSTLAVQCLTVAALLGWLATAVAGDA